jgi:hypothetical protein
MPTKKAASSRENGKKGGRPTQQACIEPVQQTEDIWDALIEAHFPDGDGLVAVLHAYVDASSRDDIGLLAVTAYLFESLRLRRFRQRWGRTFGDSTFSWADLIARSNQFKHLRGRENDAEHTRLVSEAVAIVRDNAIAAATASCWKQDLASLGPTYIKGFGHAYSVAGHMALTGLGHWAKANGHKGGIAYFVEAGDDGYDQLEHLLSYAAKSPEVRDMYQWGGHTVIPKSPRAPFHAPDLLAWEWGKYVYDTALTKKRPMRLSLANLLIGQLDRHTFIPIGGEPMLRFYRAINEIGVQQMQEDRAALASAPAVDVSDSVASAQIEPREVHG